MSDQGSKAFLDNLKTLPRNFWDSWIKTERFASYRDQSFAVFSNLWLHIHATRVNFRTLRFWTTMGLGVGSMSSFLILVVTGILLMVYYIPSTTQAYDSVKDIHYVVPSGRLIRNVHRYGAHVMVILVMLHMCRVFYTGAYKRPREYNWLIGIGLFVLTLGLSFTGYLLPWDQLAYWAAMIGSNIAGSPREITDAFGVTKYIDIGGLGRLLLLGESEVAQQGLLRFYLLHCVVLPLALALLVALHFWRIRKDGGLAKPEVDPTHAGKGVDPVYTGPDNPPEEQRKSYALMAIVRARTPIVNLNVWNTVPSWPHLLRAELVVFMAVMCICMILGLLFDAPLKELANPSLPENPAKAPWYFLGLQELVSYSAFMGGAFIPMITLLGLALIPYLDREKEDVGVYFSGRRGRRVALMSLIFAAVMSVLAVAVPVNFGWIRQWFEGRDINQLWIIAINPGTILLLSYMAWSLFILKIEKSTRMSAIALFTCFIIGFIILTSVGTYFRGPNWGFYWSQSQWPMH